MVVVVWFVLRRNYFPHDKVGFCCAPVTAVMICPDEQDSCFRINRSFLKEVNSFRNTLLLTSEFSDGLVNM